MSAHTEQLHHDATGLQLVVDTLRRRSQAALRALDILPVGVMILDSRNRPVIANRYARDLFPAWRGVMGGLTALLRQQQLDYAGCRRQATQHQAIDGNASTSRTAAMDTSRLILIPRPGELRPLPAVMFNLGATGEESGDESLNVVFFSDPDHEIVINRDRVRDIYGLTLAEARLAGLLAEGRHLRAAAAQLGITFETARTHLKRIFSKTTTTSQADLVRLLLNLTNQIG
ncbi:MAG: transcriptional regulator, LuxR family [Rhodospirillales bacterium]|nr:transcriptional regulator, LuxR family [Rhodospirillales bacterium]